MNLSVMYRGPLASCNYACGYCPFAKRTDSREQLRLDQTALGRFGDWVRSVGEHRLGVLFTPWGEALVRPWYRREIAALTRLPHVDLVAVQTNLSCGLEWLKDVCPDRLAFWATYHPGQTLRRSFLSRVARVRAHGVGVSVGVVGVPEFLAEIRDMRRDLPAEVYLWINPQQPRRRPYLPEERAAFAAIDPEFPFFARRFLSRGKACRAGEFGFTVDGRGDMRRCHFVDEVIGNIYEPEWDHALQPRLCPNRRCDCFLGQAQFAAESASSFFGERFLERVPARTVAGAARHNDACESAARPG